MNERFFLDTNIFLYLFDDAAPRKREVADQLVFRALATQKGVVSYQVVQEFFNVVLKRISKTMTANDAQQYLAEVFRPLLSVHSSTTLYKDAMEILADSRFSWYDSVIVASALHAKCDVLYTEDLQHGRKIRGLRIVNPFL